MKNLKQIWYQVPADYYQKGIKNNIFQWIWHTQKFLTFKKLIGKTTFKKILDVGCADGTFANRVSKVLPQAIITGVDVYPKSIEFGKKTYPHINFVLADAHSLPFKDNSFDLIICYETIEHVINPKQVLENLRLLLKNEGRAIIVMDSGNWLFRIVWWIWEKNKGRVWDGAHLHPFHHNELEKLIRGVGFRIIKKRFSHLGMEVSFVVKK